MSDETGFDVIPARYANNGREAIDVIRDSMSDYEFAVHCRGQALKYRLREGKKGPDDDDKARWYEQMAAHVRGLDADPRAQRPGFEPYRRASAPEPVEVLRIDVLDHGLVRLVETWGGGDTRLPEAGIIEAARQSTQGSFRGWATDRKLLRYLHEHKHATPFEFAGMVLEIRAPIFVFREWHRHRTQCLAGDSEITLVSPSGTTFKRTIAEIYQLKHGGVNDSAPARHKNGSSTAGMPVTRAARRKDPWRTRVLPNCQARRLRVLNEETLTFEIANMADVWESGVKEVFTVRAGARMLTASEEHPFFTRTGWKKLKELRTGDEIARMGKVAAQERPIPPSLRQGIGVWTTMMRTRLLPRGETACYLCGEVFPADELELDHVVPVSANLKLALDEDNLRPACSTCHRMKTDGEQSTQKEKTRRGIRWETVNNITHVGAQMTYDLEVVGPHHNYCANDLVVHNSYNEMSARYAPLPDLSYVPTIERLMIGANANRQAGAASDAEEMTVEAAKVFRARLIEGYREFDARYHDALATGVPKELARLGMPVGRYSQMRASANLRNWLGFLTLRLDPAAQWEIRQYAEAVHDLIRRSFPETAALFGESR